MPETGKEVSLSSCSSSRGLGQRWSRRVCGEEPAPVRRWDSGRWLPVGALAQAAAWGMREGNKWGVIAQEVISSPREGAGGSGGSWRGGIGGAESRESLPAPFSSPLTFWRSCWRSRCCRCTAASSAAMESNGTFLAYNSKSVEMSLRFSSLILCRALFFLLSSPPSFPSPFSLSEAKQHLICVTNDRFFFSVNRLGCVGRNCVLFG